MVFTQTFFNDATLLKKANHNITQAENLQKKSLLRVSASSLMVGHLTY